MKKLIVLISFVLVLALGSGTFAHDCFLPPGPGPGPDDANLLAWWPKCEDMTLLLQCVPHPKNSLCEL